MFERGKAVRNLTADEVARGMRHDRILLVDVREPNETALEAFPGKRSVTASQAAQAAGLPYDAHLAGGILAWKAAGHPTVS